MINCILNLAAFSLILSSSPSILSHAQTFKPNFAVNPAATFIEGQALYVIGGLDPSNNTNPLNQVFSLDLKSKWKTDNPPFTSLPSITTDYYTAAGIFDDDTLILTTRESIKTYSLSNSNLSTIGNVLWNQQQGGNLGTNAAKDTLFITNVKLQGGQDLRIRPYVTYSLTDKSLGIVSPGSDERFFAIWHDSLRVLFVSTVDYLLSFSQYKEKDVNVLKLGTDKTTLAQLKEPLCTAGTSKYSIVFGNDDGSKSSTIGSYDFEKYEWKKGQNPDFLMEPAACAVNGDYFVIWGRLSNGEASVKVYNLNGNFWTEEYGASDPAPRYSQKQIAGIAGGVSAAVVLVVAGFVYAFWRRKKSRSQLKGSQPKDSEIMMPIADNGKIEIVDEKAH